MHTPWWLSEKERHRKFKKVGEMEQYNGIGWRSKHDMSKWKGGMIWNDNE